MYLRMLESIEAKGELFLSLYNTETRHYELLCFAMYMYDCSIYFKDMLLRWKEHLPHLGEAQDVEFLEWKEKIGEATQNALNSVKSDHSYIYTGQSKNLCEEEIEGLYAIYKGDDDFKHKIEEMSRYLLDHNANIEKLVVDVGNILMDIMGQLDDSLLYADDSKYEDVYKRLSCLWESHWPALKHDEYDIFVQRLTPRVFKKNIEKRIDELLSQFITNQFEPRWQPLISCSSDWDNIYDSETRKIDTQAIGRCAIAHRREEDFTGKTLPTLLAFVRLITFMQEQVLLSETNQQDRTTPLEHIKDAMAGKDNSNNDDKLNYVAPKLALQDILKDKWFDDVTVDKNKYNFIWRQSMVEALMRTQWAQGIAMEWAEESKRLQVKFAFIGALKDVGILNCSYNALASKFNVAGIDSASLAKYMGYGKKKSYYGWLKQYVKPEIQE